MDSEMDSVGLPDGLVDAAAVARAAAPFGMSRMLPPAAYTSVDVYAWEQRHIFASSWTCVGRAADLGRADDGAPLTQRSITVGDVAVLLTWPDNAGAKITGATGAPDVSGVAAYANTCAHRSHELLPAGATATRRSITCPYHAWTYDLGGALRQAPGFRASDDFVAAEHGLVRLPVESWAGWVFVHAASTTPPTTLAEHVGAMAGLLAPYAPERLVSRASQTYEVAANWKVLVENYHECYHCPLIHPELCQVSPPTSGTNYDRPGAWVGGSMDLRPGATTMSLDGASAGVPIDGVDPRTVEYLGLFPNLLVSAHPDYVLTHRLTPLAPDRTHVECTWLFVDSQPPTDPSYAVEFWDVTNRQDWAACASVQRGLASPHARAGPLAPAEEAVYQFVRLVAETYAPHLAS